MRVRYVVNLDTDDNHEALILDYIAQHSSKKRQEVLRNLLRVGYATLIQHKKTSAAVAAGVDPETAINLLEAVLSGAITFNKQVSAPGLQFQAAPQLHVEPEGQGRALQSHRQNNNDAATPTIADKNFESSIKPATPTVAAEIPYVDVDNIVDDDENPLTKLMSMMEKHKE